MLQFAHLFLNIALLQRNPQDLPASPQLLRLSVAALLLTYVMAISGRYPLLESLGRAAADIAFLALFVYLVLVSARLPARFTQSFTALCGAGAILNLVSWPLAHALNNADRQIGTGLAFLVSFILVWEVAVTAHVFRQALQRSWPHAVAVALIYLFGAYAMSAWLFGEDL